MYAARLSLLCQMIEFPSMDIVKLFQKCSLTPKVDLYRRPGQSRITTPRKETDTCKILSGTHEGVVPTTIEDKIFGNKNVLAFLSAMTILLGFMQG